MQEPVDFAPFGSLCDLRVDLSSPHWTLRVKVGERETLSGLHLLWMEFTLFHPPLD